MPNERELTGSVDLCNGRRLAADARGWSRFPRLRANLRGAWGRKKRWDYWCVITPDLIVAMTYADIDYAGLASCWVLERDGHRTAAASVIRPFGRGIELPEQVCTGVMTITHPALSLRIEELDDETRLWAQAPSDGGDISIGITVAKPTGHESLNVVIPWSDRRFQFTSKQNTRPASGTVTLGDRVWNVGGDDAYGVQDLGRGIWPYSNRWNWAAGSGRSVAGTTIGLQFGGKWTEGTGYTENALCVDGRLTKISDELEWDYSWVDPMRPWHLGGDGIDLTLRPWYDRYDNTDLKVLKMQVHQCFGTWSGTVVDAAGATHRIDAIDGFAEEARNRW